MHRWVMMPVLAMALSGCMNVSDMAGGVRHHLGDAGLLDHSETQRASSRRLQADSFIYIAQSPFMPLQERQRVNAVAEEAYRGFVEYFPLVRHASAPVGLQQARMQAMNSGAHYLLYGRLAAADDRIGTVGEWEDQESLSRLGVDSGVVQLMLLETNTGYLVDTVRIRPRGGLLTMYGTTPEELLGAPMRQYARNLLGLN